MIFPSVIPFVHCSEKLPIIMEKGIKEKMPEETGWNRIRRMYTIDEFGYSPEMKYIIRTGMYTVSAAGVVGGIAGMIKVKEEFHRKKKASKFESQYLAKRHLTNLMSMALLKEGITSAFKYGSFCSLYFLSTLTIANYRNKMSVWEHAASGAVFGGFSQMNYGLKGFAVAGALGGVLGLIAGGFITMSLGFGKMTLDEFRCWLDDHHYLRILYNQQNQEKPSS